MQLPEPITIVQSFVDAVNRHEIDEVVAMFDEDATLSVEPPLPGSPKRVYSGRGEIKQWLGTLMAEHLSIVASNCKASGSEVTCDARISADRFAAIGADPVQTQVRSALDGSFFRSIAFNLSKESVRRIQAATAAQPA